MAARSGTIERRTAKGPSTSALVTAFGLVGLAALATLYMAMRSMEADAWVIHSFEVRQTATKALSLLTDAETGQRGYLLTGDQIYLEPFQTAEVSLPETLKALRQQVADNPEQSGRISTLTQLADARQTLARDTIAKMQAGDAAGAVALVKSGRGKQLMDQIRVIIDAMSQSERALLESRQKEAATTRTALLGLAGASLLAAVALAGVLARATRQALQQERQRTTELETEIRHHRETQDTLRQAQKIEALGQLTGGIAHDFNNLLTIVIGNLDTLRRRLTTPRADEDVSALASRLQGPVDLEMQGARSAARLTHRLLAFARRQPLAPASVDLNRLVADMSDLLRRTLGETINIETVLSGGLWATFADSNEIENALINLCVNARDAMPEGGQLTIETANTYLDEAYARQFGDVTAGQYVQLSVADTGSGIPPDLLTKAFEPFFTTKPAGQGSGLGLAMVHGFVKQSGGHIRIYSEVGHGTTVKIYLPRLTSEQQVASIPVARSTAALDVPRAGPNETILLVEDNEGVRQFGRGALEDLGYTVIETADAQAALRIVESDRRIDLLFTDVVLPGLSGSELATRALQLRPGLPVLFTTGYTRNAIIHHGRLDPGVHLLSKPFAQSDLARKLRELLDEKNATPRPRAGTDS
jgi:signal transduction histidine kinase/ActR/RegA family two-component response regulator